MKKGVPRRKSHSLLIFWLLIFLHIWVSVQWNIPDFSDLYFCLIFSLLEGWRLKKFGLSLQIWAHGPLEMWPSVDSLIIIFAAADLKNRNLYEFFPQKFEAYEVGSTEDLASF